MYLIPNFSKKTIYCCNQNKV